MYHLWKTLRWQVLHCSYLVELSKYEDSGRGDAWNENLIRNDTWHQSLLDKQGSEWNTKDVNECVLGSSYTSKSCTQNHILENPLKLFPCQWSSFALVVVLQLYMNYYFFFHIIKYYNFGVHIIITFTFMPILKYRPIWLTLGILTWKFSYIRMIWVVLKINVVK